MPQPLALTLPKIAQQAEDVAKSNNNNNKNICPCQLLLSKHHVTLLIQKTTPHVPCKGIGQ